MRRRLTLTFIAVAFGLAALSFAMRSVMLLSATRADEADELRREAEVIAYVVKAETEAGRVVSSDLLARFRQDDQMVQVKVGSTSVLSAGPTYDGHDEPLASNDAVGLARAGDVEVLVSQSRRVAWDLVMSSKWILLAFALSLVGVAGAVGLALAGALAAPFRQLAEAATSLGRGRFDLDLPDSRIAEVQKIAAALRTSADQVQIRIGQEQLFAEHASHVLRSPLTALRLDLDELAASETLPDDLEPLVTEAVAKVERLDALTGEIVHLARRGRDTGTAGISLHDLALASAKQWRAELEHHERSLTLVVEGDPRAIFTAGPLEQVQELLLTDTLNRSRGSVVLTFGAVDAGSRMTIKVVAEDNARSRPRPGVTFQRAVAVVTAVGGRVKGEQYVEGVEVTLPGR